MPCICCHLLLCQAIAEPFQPLHAAIAAKSVLLLLVHAPATIATCCCPTAMLLTAMDVRPPPNAVRTTLVILTHASKVSTMPGPQLPSLPMAAWCQSSPHVPSVALSMLAALPIVWPLRPKATSVTADHTMPPVCSHHGPKTVCCPTASAVIEACESCHHCMCQIWRRVYQVF